MPIAVPPPPPDDQSPATPAKVVSIGQAREEVIAISGRPQRDAKFGAKEILYYKDLRVTLVSGKVTEVQPIARYEPSGPVYKIGEGVSGPRLLKKFEPEYTDEARNAKWQGTVALLLVVDEAGKPHVMKLTKVLGMGLDEEATEAVERWLFKPGRKGGEPVAVYTNVEISFHLGEPSKK